MAKRNKEKSKNIDQVGMGFEPVLTEVNGVRDINLIKSFNWYNYMYDAKRGKVWLIKWMKENNHTPAYISSIKHAPDWVINTTACWSAKMALNGTILAQENIDFINRQIGISVDRHKALIVEKEEDDRPKPTIQSRIQAKNRALAEQAEALVDQIIDGEELDMYDFLLRNEGTPVLANFLKSIYEPILEELMSDDEDVVEAYGKTLKRWQKIYQTIIDDIDRFANNKKVVRKRRITVKKVKPISAIVKNLKYQKEDTTLKVVSVNPEQLVGASSVWLYNTKYKSLTNLSTNAPTGLGVKGTTIINYDVATAISKKLRKPEETIAKLLASGKVGVRTFMDALTTKPGGVNGRINNNIIILKVIK